MRFQFSFDTISFLDRSRLFRLVAPLVLIIVFGCINKSLLNFGCQIIRFECYDISVRCPMIRWRCNRRAKLIVIDAYVDRDFKTFSYVTGFCHYLLHLRELTLDFIVVRLSWFVRSSSWSKISCELFVRLVIAGFNETSVLWYLLEKETDFVFKTLDFRHYFILEYFLISLYLTQNNWWNFLNKTFLFLIFYTFTWTLSVNKFTCLRSFVFDRY